MKYKQKVRQQIQSSLFNFPDQNLHKFLISTNRATCPVHLILFYLITLITELW
jgi:hypothetical protein